MTRVAITGIGAVTPLGNSFYESWSAAKAGKTGLGPVTRFQAAGFPWKIAGELKGFDATAFLNRKETLRLDPFAQYAVAASVMAAEDAGLIRVPEAGSRQYPITYPTRDYLSSGGVLIGSSRGGVSTLEEALTVSRHAVPGPRLRRLSPYLMPSTTISMAATYSAMKLGIKGHCLGISNACASGTNAIGEAFRLIKSGYKGPVLAGGADAPVCRLCLEGYGSSGALSEAAGIYASRPFDGSRDGFVLSEGACVMVLENLDEALKRGAAIYGEIAGYGSTNDAFHQTRPDRAGEVRAMKDAIKEAGLDREEIDCISAHGTSTPLGDRVESEAIEAVFGARGLTVPISAVKSMTGHMLAASGALEAAFLAMSIREGVIPPTINLTEKDKDCRINVVTELLRASPRAALSSSFGFGGVNAVLVIKGSY